MSNTVILDKEKLVPLMGPSKSRLLCFPWGQKRLKCHNLDFPLLKPITSSILFII